ncbi:MAG: hypothetical protein R3183_01630 [Oleiphilaceae bacterium]|nr:hypothetical protein [Oleiphilaceae bacterium]
MAPTEQQMKTRLIELCERRDTLSARLDAIKKDFSKGLDRDWEEQAIELENAEVLDEIARVSQDELRKIEQAIERLENELAHHH